MCVYSDNCVLTMTLLLALDQSRTCRHVINWQEGRGGGYQGHRIAKGRRAGMEESAYRARLIYYVITLTLVTWRCSSIKPTWPGTLCIDPLLNDLSV